MMSEEFVTIKKRALNNTMNKPPMPYISWKISYGKVWLRAVPV